MAEVRTEEQIAEQKSLDLSHNFIDLAYKHLNLDTTINAAEVLGNDNPHKENLLSFLNSWTQEDLKSLTFSRDSEGLHLKYTNNNEEEVTDIIKKEDPEYKAIFWPELQKEAAKKKVSAVALQKRAEFKGGTEREALKPAASVLQAHLDKRYQTANTERDKYISDLGKTDVKTLRSSRNLLTKDLEIKENKDKVSNAKTETARRLAAYTTQGQEAWYELNYKKVANKHEINIGLGDILIDEDITEIEVQQKGRTFKAKRGFTANGRPCFQEVNEDGKIIDNYVATFTGDKFRILSDKETNLKKEEQVKSYLEKLEQTDVNVKKHKEYIEKHGLKTSFRFRRNSINISKEEAKNSKPVSDAFIKGKLDGQNIDGQKVINDAKKACDYFDLEWEMVRELMQVENGTWDVDLDYRDPSISSAGGLGQFLNSTWEGFVTTAKAKRWKEKFGQNWASNWDTLKGKHDPYAMVFATAWNIKNGLDKLDIPDNINIAEKGALAYLVHHEGGAAKHYLKFLSLMQQNGHNTKEQVKAAYLANPEKYNAVLYHRQISRIGKRGLDNFLKVYFGLAKRIGARAAKVSGQIDKIKNTGKLEMPKNSTNSLYDGQKDWIFGSSIARGINSVLQHDTTGALGTRSATCASFTRDMLTEDNIAAIKQIQMPKKITLLGFAHNEFAGSNLPVKQSIDAHFILVEKLKSAFPGVTIKIAQAHKYDKKEQNKKIEEFNQTLSTKHPDLYIKAVEKTPKLHPAIGGSEYKAMRDAIKASAPQEAESKLSTNISEAPKGTLTESPDKDKVALTFDICSCYKHNPQRNKNVLKTLDLIKNKSNYPVTLFVTGTALEDQKIATKLKELSKLSHVSIQAHGNKHRPVTASHKNTIWGQIPTGSLAAARKEITEGVRQLEALTGKKITHFRSATLMTDEATVAMTKELGYIMTGRTAGADDAGGSKKDAGNIKKGQIYLAHAINFKGAQSIYENLANKNLKTTHLR